MSELLPPQHVVPRCFGCGLENPAGLKLRFVREDERTVSTTFTTPAEWTGWRTLVHGGFLALLLDETTAWAAWALGGERAFLTRELRLQFRRPASVGEPLTIRGTLGADDGRQITVAGAITNARGELLTEAEALLVRVDPERLAP